MKARLGAWIENLGDQFWLRPAIVVLLCMGLAQLAVTYDHSTSDSTDLSSATWGYSGGGEGARSLLGAVASSTIGVASTIFSITIAALSLASGQMGPRLLRNFVRDSRNQIGLGIFLGTFAYALMVLRTVRTVQEGAFVPHLAVTGAVALALVSIATLVWFVHHIASSINVETVVDAVHQDLCDAIAKKTLAEADPLAPEPLEGLPVSVTGSDYLQAVDLDGLADWAARHGIAVRLRVRPGDYVPSGAPVASLSTSAADAREALDQALTFGRRPAALQDLEYPIRQLREIAVRALSPGINDPFTAAGVLDRFGDALCRIAPRHLASGAVERDRRIVVVLPTTDYDGLCDAMFHTIRQNAESSAFVLIRLIAVLGRVAEVERSTPRLETLCRHAELARHAVETGTVDASGRSDFDARYRGFLATVSPERS